MRGGPLSVVKLLLHAVRSRSMLHERLLVLRVRRRSCLLLRVRCVQVVEPVLVVRRAVVAGGARVVHVGDAGVGGARREGACKREGGGSKLYSGTVSQFRKMNY